MNPVFAVTPVRAAALALLCTLAGCSTVENWWSGDKVDYRSQATKNQPLDIPPDLAQLARDTRYQPATGVVSASALQQQGGAGAAQTAAGAASAPTLAVAAIGDLRVAREGNQRWLVTGQPPERLWGQLRAFWTDRGFTLSTDNAELGVMETDWAESRARINGGVARNLIGKLLDSVSSTSERDRYRTRVERTANGGSEIYISHRGMVEVSTDKRQDSTIWQPRPTDPELEAEQLTSLMVRLGTSEDVARPAVANAPNQPTRARLLTGQAGSAMEVDEAFDRAWRRVGLALDRGGFTVEDRDRTAGLYYVRYVDPKSAGKDEPNFFSNLWNKWFGGSDKGAASANLQRYRLSVKAVGDKTQVAVLNSQGNADKGEAAEAIVNRLVDELK